MSRAGVSELARRSSVLLRSGLLLWCALSAPHLAKAQDPQGIEELRMRAEAAYAEGRLLEALSDFERLVSLFPEEGCLHGRLAGCALKEPGRLAMARRHLRIAVKQGCADVDLEFHRARMAQLEYDFERARDLYAAYLAAAGKKGRFKAEAETAAAMCGAAVWDPQEAVGLKVLDRYPADPDGAFRFYRPETPGLRLVNTPKALRSKADGKVAPGRIAFHNGDTVVVYASLGKSGKTGWDLYSIPLTGGEYGEAERLSDTINTEYDERGAYLAPEGILYFSSNRPGGLGGQDIYAVKWENGPVGVPERLPFPINSVNDDEFFIPEPDGGAWMSSNRAAREGRIHAYRVALSAAPFDAGSVSWMADEVESSGMTLRVYAQGEEVVTRALDGEGAEHEALPELDGAIGLRIVLEGEGGDIVSEAFGSNDSAWELRKQGRGWSLEERTEVDWAMLADLREEATGPAVTGASALDVETGGAEPEKAELTPPSWGQWIGARLELSAPTAPVPTAEPDLVAVEVDVTTSSAPSDLKEPTEAVAQSGSSTDVLKGRPNPSPGSDSVVPLDGEGADVVDASSPSTQPDSAPRTVSEVVEDGDVPTPEERSRMVEQEPQALAEVWNEKARMLLEQESQFLDSPSMVAAGILSEQVEALSEWVPDAELMAPEVRDGAALEDVRYMIETWTTAVQSATKASLAEVAGDAALAYRRERLAIREIQAMRGAELAQAIQAASDWQTAKGETAAESDEAFAEDEILPDALEQWAAGLADAEEGWTRKERSGWRGEWLKRQQRHLEVVRDQWERHLEELAVSSEPIAVVETDPEPMEPVRDMEFLTDPFGNTSSETLARFVLGEAMETESGTEVEARLESGEASGRWMAGWQAAIHESRSVERAWQELVNQSGGNGVPLVTELEDFEAMEAGTAKELLNLKEAMLDLLSGIAEGERKAVNEDVWDAVVEGAETSGSAVLEGALARRSDWEEAVSRSRTAASQARKARGAERFESQRAWHAALMEEARRLSLMELEEDAIRAELARIETASLAMAEAERIEAERVEAQRFEAERIEAERIEAERIEAERMEAERTEAERIEAERIETERIEAERIEAERIEAERTAGVEDVVKLVQDELPASWTPARLASMLDDQAQLAEQDELSLTPAEDRLLRSWRAWREAKAAMETAASSRRNLSAREKDVFFASRDVRKAIQEVDLDAMERRLKGEEIVEIVAEDVAESETLSSDAGTEGETLVTVSSDAASNVDPVRDRVERQYEVTLPAAEVVGVGARSGSGIRLRPIERDAFERAILARAANPGESAELAAAEVFAVSDGRPRAEGIEYKVQVGAFRKSLPAAIFSVFDPMWAQRLDNGITRYLAGSFDAYDAAVVARDAIRDLGYSDAFVVRFVGGERVRAARPDADRLAVERSVLPEAAASTAVGVAGMPVEAEDIPTWEGVQGRVYSVQVGAFRGVPDARSLEVLGTLTREDAGSDGWLRLFSGRFASESDAVEHRDDLRSKGRADAFVVVYINGRRTPLSQARTTAVTGIAGVGQPEESRPLPAQPVELEALTVESGWRVELGRFSSTIPVRLANAILDAPLDWEIRSERRGTETVYLTRLTSDQAEAEQWMAESRRSGFSSARLLEQTN
ncbi:MAG: SPOR domain-containing protein [Bacteroidota bacterium]|nr:SPOR domain-containing protein [Bacteroidota bacterium]